MKAALCFFLLACAPLADSQTGPTASAPAASGWKATGDTPNFPSSYLLGPNDQVSLVVDQLEDDFNEKTFRIDQNGDLSIPLIGRIHAGGLTQAELEDTVRNRFGAILKAPDIVVNVTEYSSQPVSVAGAVNTPGIRQLQGGKTLFEVISLAGGLRPDAGTTVKITRDLKWGAIPLPGAVISPNGQCSIAVVRLKRVMQASDENILMRPGDTVFVPKADVVYVVGSVTTPGGFPIGENETLSALQVVALAQGMVRTAAPDRAKILRAVAGAGNRSEIPINLKLLMAGKAPDTPLQPDDILFVPNSAAKSAEFRTIEAIVNAATGVAIYGRY
ncbi:MAG: polysaccharide biosynthesis/export family protein [Bryobacteraceae bacterium]|jgi:polysaccharide export outer membrane protein